MSSLPPGLDEFGRRLEQAAAREIDEHEPARRPRRRRRWRNLGLPVVAALLAAAVSAGAVRLVDGGTGDPIAPEPGDESARLQAPEDPAVIVSSAAADPEGGPSWVVRAFTDPVGRECLQLGRLRDGVFGQVQQGRFRRLPGSAPATCAPQGADEPLLAVRTGAERTVVYGLAVGRATVTVRLGDRERRVRPAGLGAFVAVFSGVQRDAAIVVRSQERGRMIDRRL